MISDVKSAIASALVDLEVMVVTNVPGYGGSETFGAFNSITEKLLPISFNEEVAYTVAHGASIVGKRSSVFMKSHGILKAANSISDSLYTELTAGFVILIFEDKIGDHSDNILEIEPVLKGMSFPYKISKPASIYSDVIDAYIQSEKLKLPFALLVDASQINTDTEFDHDTTLRYLFEYRRDVYNHIVHPMLADYQYLKLTTKLMGGDINGVIRPNIPTVPEELPERSRTASEKYLNFFEIFREMRGDIVTGDTSASSAYAFNPYKAIDIVTYIGGSIPLAIGAHLAGFKEVWALTGDFGFIAAGHMGLLEAFSREIPLKIVIFNNKQAAATGGQPIQKKILMRILAGYERNILHITNPQDLLEISETLKEAKASNELNIILVDY